MVERSRLMDKNELLKMRKKLKSTYCIYTSKLNILPNLTVAENMFLGKRVNVWKTGILRTRQMNAIAQQQLAELGLHVKGAMLAELSVGQQQIIEVSINDNAKRYYYR